MSRSRSPTRAQLSSRLAYEKKVPAFLQKLQNQYSGGGYRGDEDEPQIEFEGDEGGLDEFGREIRRAGGTDEFGREIRDGEGQGRPPIPERPSDDPGSAEEDDDDEKPQVVVLKEGKHLTEGEAEIFRRKEKGLPPLSDPSTSGSAKDQSSKPPDSNEKPNKAKSSSNKGLSFTSGSTSASTSKSSAKNFKKRMLEAEAEMGISPRPSSEKEPKKKKAKKESKKLLSFGDDA